MSLDDLVEQVVEERSLEALDLLLGSKREDVLDALVLAAGRLIDSDDPDEVDDEIVDAIRGRVVEARATGPLIDGLNADVEATQEFALACLAEIGDMVAFEPMVRLLEEGNASLKRAAAEQLALLTNYDFGQSALKWREWNDRRIKGLSEQKAEDREDQARRLNLRFKGTNVTEAAQDANEQMY